MTNKKRKFQTGEVTKFCKGKYIKSALTRKYYVFLGLALNVVGLTSVVGEVCLPHISDDEGMSAPAVLLTYLLGVLQSQRVRVPPYLSTYNLHYILNCKVYNDRNI